MVFVLYLGRSSEASPQCQYCAIPVGNPHGIDRVCHRVGRTQTQIQDYCIEARCTSVEPSLLKNLKNSTSRKINPLVTTKSVLFFSWKVNQKIRLGVQKPNIKFYFDIFIRHKDIEVWIFSDFFLQCAFVYGYRLTILLECIAKIIRNSDLLEFLCFEKFRFLNFEIF